MKLKNNLQSITCYVFRGYCKCDERCKHKDNPEVYRPKNLSYSRYLTGNELLQDFILLFGTFAKVSENLIQIGSAQNNESFNRTVATTNPKTHFYSGSESTAFRVASVVVQRNDGVGFISKVYDNLHMSPGDNTARYIVTEKENIRDNESKPDSTSEIKEGATYQPAVDLEPSQCSTDEIPSQLQPPTWSAHIVNNPQSDFLFFDLETTGLDESDIEKEDERVVLGDEDRNSDEEKDEECEKELYENKRMIEEVVREMEMEMC